MFHVMQSTNFRTQADKAAKGAAQKTIGLSSLAEMTLPVPDLDKQQRLINIIDQFNTICTNLNVGLPAEIEARKKQYEYYRDKLLSFKSLSLSLIHIFRQHRFSGTRRRGVVPTCQ